MRPCHCNKGIPASGPIPKYVYGFHCGLCYVWHTDAARQRAWGGSGDVRPVASLKTSSSAKSQLPLRVIPCKDLGLKAVNNCGCADRHCNLGHGVVRHLEHCQTCNDYVRKGEGDASVLERVESPIQLPVMAFRVSAVPPKRITVNLPGHFNAGMIEFQGKLLMASRLHSSIFLSELDQDFQPVWSKRMVLNHSECRNGQEDPRLILFRGKPLLWFNGIWSDKKHVRVNQLYAILNDDLSVESIHAPQYGKRRDREKNWTPFEVDGQLYAVYSIAPHVVLRLNGDKVEEEYATTNLLPWTGGFLRGGAPPVRVGDRFVSFFHGNLPIRHPKRETHYVYSVGVCEFEAAPPFKVTRQTPEPLLWAGESDRFHGHPIDVVFPCGAVRKSGEWLVSQGTRDEAVEVCRWNEADIRMIGPMPLHSELSAKLDEVQALPGWTSPEKARYLARHVLQYRPTIAVEVGVFGGRSLLPVALAMKEIGLGGAIYGIDPWDNTSPLEGTQKEWDAEWWSKWTATETRDAFLAAVSRFNLDNQVRVINKKSADAVKQFTVNSVDYIHIDGNHSPEVSLQDVQTWWPKLRSGGWLIADDADWSSTQSAMKWLAGKCVEHETRDFINEDGQGGRTRFFRKP